MRETLAYEGNVVNAAPETRKLEAASLAARWLLLLSLLSGIGAGKFADAAGDSQCPASSSDVTGTSIFASALPCTFSGGLPIQVSWTALSIPVNMEGFTSAEQLHAAILRLVHPICEQHRTRHALDVAACEFEIRDAVSTAIARVCPAARAAAWAEAGSDGARDKND